ncbi:MAG: TOMM precursor leader peptide-binding protein, partial [Betaproteobacteria bacterium]|nr:TOMM precursor leader peptide-binding protein [Betaproteobacteria bacterium]
GIVGSLQAAEALKLMASAGRSLAGRLLLIDALDMDIHTIRIARNPQCPVCGDAARLQSSTTSPLSAAEPCDSRVTRR